MFVVIFLVSIVNVLGAQWGKVSKTFIKSKIDKIENQIQYEIKKKFFLNNIFIDNKKNIYNNK